jgi:hypothetical protein
VRVLKFGALIAAGALAAALLFPHPLVMDVALILVGFGLSNIVPIVFSAAGRSDGTRGVAMTATLGYAGLLVAPPILGMVAQATGLRLALALVACWIAAVAAMSASAGAPRRPA